MSKWLAKHISTKVSFKTTIRKRHIYFDIRWPWIWSQYFYLGIWNDDLLNNSFASISARYTIKITDTNETEFINGIWHIKLFTNISISNWNNWSFDPTKMKFLTSFSSLHDYWPLSTWNPLVHTSWGEMERCEERGFQLLKKRKKTVKT